MLGRGTVVFYAQRKGSLGYVWWRRGMVWGQGASVGRAEASLLLALWHHMMCL